MCTCIKNCRTNSLESGQKQHWHLISPAGSWLLPKHPFLGLNSAPVSSHHTTGLSWRSARGWACGPSSPRDQGDEAGAGYRQRPLGNILGWIGRCFWSVTVCWLWQPLAAWVFWITFLDLTAYVSSNFHFRLKVGAVDLILQSSLHNLAPKKGSGNEQNPPTCWARGTQYVFLSAWIFWAQKLTFLLCFLSCCHSTKSDKVGADWKKKK